MESYKIQYASDLHLDQDDVPFETLIDAVAPDLALCGDICSPWNKRYAEFLKWCSNRWTRIFLVSGNHEYFDEGPDTWVDGETRGYLETETQIRNVVKSAGNNIYFLQENAFQIEQHKIMIIGTTLWTTPNIRRWDMLSSGVIGSPGCRGEYRAMWRKDEYTAQWRNFHPSDISAINNHQTTFLKKILNKSWGGVPEGWRVIVLTHHMPTFKLNAPEFADAPLNSCYANNLDELFKEPVVAWICGHSHRGTKKRCDTGTLLCLNPRGYKSEAGKTGYVKKAVVTVYAENIANADTS
jgi:predicted phosphodiesterase